MRVGLTQTYVDKLAFVPAKEGDKPIKENTVFDAKQRGLMIRVFASGEKTYYVKLKTGRAKLDSCAKIKLAAARTAAAVMLGKAAVGSDPVRERQEAKLQAKLTAAHDKLTLRALFDNFEALKRAELRSRTLSEMKRAIHRVFKNHLDVPAAKIDRAIAIGVLDELVKKGSPTMAHRANAYLCTLYAWAVSRGTLQLNPFVKMPYGAGNSRDRVLTDEELRAIWTAAEGMGVYGAIVRLIMLTGARREEVADIRWSELSSDFAVWTLPKERAKNHNALVLPLPAPVRAIIAAQERVDGSPHVFPSVRPGVSFANFSACKDLIDEASGVAGWRLHDLRRTVATNLQKLGVRLEVTEAILNHVSGSRGGIVGVYQRHEWTDEKRAALDAWGERLIAVIDGRAAASNVIPIRAQGA
jgi:integrase